MRDKPILFSGTMIRAILEGRKTQTRRVVVPTQTKPRIPPLTMEPWVIDGVQETDDHGVPCWIGAHPDYPMGDKWFSCPYGKEGDRLWVRETWAVDAPLDQARREHEDVMCGIGSGPYYRADKVHEHAGLTWRPSIFMPRWASRISLAIVGVRVERLQDITGNDVIAEGIDFPNGTNPQTAWRDRWEPFQVAWDGINGKRGYSWENNPWVWVVEFRKAS